MYPRSTEYRGHWQQLEVESEALRENPLGDPHVRPLWVWTPPGYDAVADRYPSVYVIQGMTGELEMWWNRISMRPTYPELVDRLAPECVVVLVDAWTSLGGSQFVDSPATGNYHTYLCNDVVSFVDAHFRTLAASEHRGIAGKSSGGYGAMITPMLRPDVFGGLATHAGDALFEVCYQPEFGQCARSLRDEYSGSYERFWEDFRSRPAHSKESDQWLINAYCMAACYSAQPDGTVELPFDTATGALNRDVFDRWLAWDPPRMVPRYAEALRGLHAIWIDAGTRDEYFLDLGAEAFRRELAEIGVTDIHFELFDGSHAFIEYRYPLALAYLAERLAPR